METKPRKPKKQLTPKQLKNRYRLGQWSCFVGEFVSVFLPYIVIGAVKFDEYFVQTGENSWKVSLGGILAMCVMGLATWLVGRKKENKEITNGFIALILGWFTTAFILFLLSSIIHDISMIMMWGGIGLLGALGLDVASGKFKEEADYYKTSIRDKKRQSANLDDQAEIEAKKQELIEQKLEERRKKGLR